MTADPREIRELADRVAEQYYVGNHLGPLMFILSLEMVHGELDEDMEWAMADIHRWLEAGEAMSRKEWHLLARWMEWAADIRGKRMPDDYILLADSAIDRIKDLMEP